MSKHYHIKKGVEPAKSGRSFGKLVDLSKMEVGDCFTYPQVDEARVKSLVDTYGKKNGAAFLVTVSESQSTCWRTA
jgi:hypothetical protein